MEGSEFVAPRLRDQMRDAIVAGNPDTHYPLVEPEIEFALSMIEPIVTRLKSERDVWRSLVITPLGADAIASRLGAAESRVSVLERGVIWANRADCPLASVRYWV